MDYEEDNKDEKMIRPTFYVPENLWREFSRIAYQMDQRPRDVLLSLLRRWMKHQERSE